MSARGVNATNGRELMDKSQEHFYLPDCIAEFSFIDFTLLVA